eukprot:1162105-Pelagomonas_calceolata.AAC.7
MTSSLMGAEPACAQGGRDAQGKTWLHPNTKENMATYAIGAEPAYAQGNRHAQEKHKFIYTSTRRAWPHSWWAQSLRTGLA